MSFHLGANASNNCRKKSTDAVVTAFDVGSTNPSARILIYSGSQPATPETSASGTLLVTIAFNNPSFAAADATGTSALAGGTAVSGTVTTSGTAGYFRVVDRNGNSMGDGTVGTSGTDMVLSDVNLVVGGTVTINTFSIQTPMS